MDMARMDKKVDPEFRQHSICDFALFICLVAFSAFIVLISRIFDDDI